MMLVTRIIHIYRIFLYTHFQRIYLYGQMDAFRSSTSRRFYHSMSSALYAVPALKAAVMLREQSETSGGY